MPTQNIAEMIQIFKSNKESYFEYIDNLETTFNLYEPKIQAFIPEDNRFDRLRAEASKLFEAYPEIDTSPKLFGLLIGVKDIFNVDGFPTRAGSNLPPETFIGQESHVVTKLRKAGALIFGKTVTTEFAYFSPGPTRNPHNPAHTPGGSSSGSAAAVAAGLVPFATGTQTIGSISRPASFCGVVGFKPSYGRFSTQGVIPLSPSLDHIGFFSENIASARFMAENLIENWNITKYNHRQPILGIPIGPYLAHASNAMIDHFNETCNHLANAGYIVKTVEVMNDFNQIKENHMNIMAGEAFAVHKEWYEKYAPLYHYKTAELIMRGRSIREQELKKALAGRKKLRSELIQAMTENQVDLMLSPGATGPAPKGLKSTGDPVMNLPWTYSGLPSVCISSGKTDNNLPLGLQISGLWNQDEMLLNWTIKLEHDLARRIK